jgi:hypothetical protein
MKHSLSACILVGMRNAKKAAPLPVRLVALTAIALATLGADLPPHDRDPWLPVLTKGQDDPACQVLLGVVRNGYRSPIYDLDLDTLPWPSDAANRVEKLPWTEVRDQRVGDRTYQQDKGKYYTIDLGTLGLGRTGLLADFYFYQSWQNEGYVTHLVPDAATLDDLIPKMFPAVWNEETRAAAQTANRSTIYVSHFRHTPVLRYRDRLFIFETDNSNGVYARRTDVDTSRFSWNELTPDGKLLEACRVEARPKLDYWRALPNVSTFAPSQPHRWHTDPHYYAGRETLERDPVHPYLKAVISSGPLADLLVLLGDIVGDEAAGWQGTMDAWGYRSVYNREAVVAAHLRPWAFADPKARQNRDAYYNFDAKLGFLRAWGLQGPWQHKKVAEFEALFARAIPTLSAWYEKRFGYSTDDARQVARTALEGLTVVFLSGGGSADGFTDEGFVSAIARNLANPPKDKWDKPYLVDFESCGNQYLRALALAGAPIPNLQALLNGHATLGRPKANVYCGSLRAFDPLLSYALDRPDVLEFFISRGADVNETNHAGKTPLMTAAHMNNLAAARVFVDSGAEVNARTFEDFGEFGGGAEYNIKYRQRTALMYAAENAGPEMVALLVAHGADPSIKDGSGRDVLDYLSRNRVASDEERETIHAMLVEAAARRR